MWCKLAASAPDNSLHVLYDDSTTYSVNTHNSGIQIENNNGTDNTFSQLHFRDHYSFSSWARVSDVKNSF